jgi:hypothetical protein
VGDGSGDAEPEGGVPGFMGDAAGLGDATGTGEPTGLGDATGVGEGAAPLSDAGEL